MEIIKSPFGKHKGENLLSVLWKDPGNFVWLTGEVGGKNIKAFCERVIHLIDEGAHREGTCHFCHKRKATSIMIRGYESTYDNIIRKYFEVVGPICDECFLGAECFRSPLTLGSVQGFPHKVTKEAILKVLLSLSGFDNRKRFSAERLGEHLDVLAEKYEEVKPVIQSKVLKNIEPQSAWGLDLFSQPVSVIPQRRRQ